MDTGRPRKDHRAKTRAEQVDALDQLGAAVAEEMLFDLARTVPLVEGDAVRHEPPIDERLDPVLDQLEADGAGEPVAEAVGRCRPAVLLLGSGRDDRAKTNVQIQTGGEPFTSAKDNLGTLRVVEAAYRSMSEARSVSPSEIVE